MFGIILSGIIIVGSSIGLKYYKKYSSKVIPIVVDNDKISTSNELVDISFNSIENEEYVISLYSDVNYLGNKKELSVGIYSRQDINFVINSIKFISKKGNVLFYKDDIRIRAYTTDIPNTIEFVKSINGWNKLQICKF